MKEIKTKRLILRGYLISDWKDLVEGIGDFEVSKWLKKVPYPYTEKDAKDYLKKSIKRQKKNDNTNYVFALYHKKDKKFIGSVGLHAIDYFSGVATTGSWLNKQYWRQGYITEAKIAVNNFAFNKLKLRRLGTDIYVDNIASNSVQEKLGYKLEGVKRKAARSKATEKIHDVNIYGLLKEDWLKIKNKLR
ncbi:MAG: hypothetical protein RI945_224 [Candidatus Parcubacteria bacterium]|jgi:RimJ/RimL family protein N-acetyltransferase